LTHYLLNTKHTNLLKFKQTRNKQEPSHKEVATENATNHYARNGTKNRTNQAIALEQTRAHPSIASQSPPLSNEVYQQGTTP